MSLFYYSVPLAVVILGRDVILVLASFYLRYITIPPPVSFLLSFFLHFQYLQ